jgi:DNA-binding CsgD family transcriptional regulator
MDYQAAYKAAQERERKQREQEARERNQPSQAERERAVLAAFVAELRQGQILERVGLRAKLTPQAVRVYKYLSAHWGTKATNAEIAAVLFTSESVIIGALAEMTHEGILVTRTENGKRALEPMPSNMI